MSSERRCVCCGFSSFNAGLFKRAKTEAPSWLKYGNDDWICRSYRDCCERGLVLNEGKT